MATLQWSAALALNVPAMDDTHKEFVDLLAAVESATDAQLGTRWQALLAHTEAHFAQEDQWMQATGFASGNCHATQHRVVLEIMQEGAKQAADGDCTMVRGMAPELAAWFSHHAQTMDAALAQHMQRVGLDTATGTVRHPQALPQDLIRGCGGACSQPSDPTAHVQQAA